MTGKLLLVTILCLLGGSALGSDILEGNYNVTACCSAVKTGTQLGSIESCQKYYVCQSSGPVVAECQSGYSYDYKKSVCAPSDQVHCYWGVEEPCAGKNGTWVPNTKVCGGYYWCSEGKALAGRCPSNQLFDVASQKCYYGKCSSALDNSAEGATVLGSICDVVPPGQYFGDTENCATWHYCENNGTGVVLQSGVCNSTSQVAYNVKSGTCDYSSDSVCSRVTGNPLSNAPVACPTPGAMKADPNTCGTYFVCTNKQWVSTNCASGYYFDVKSSSCKTRQAATPIEGCNRCQGSKTQFVNAVDSDNCSKYYYCDSKGAALEESCGEDLYFDEQMQGCRNDESLAKYVLTNGACLGATAGGSSGSSSSTSSTSSTSSSGSSSSTSSSSSSSVSTSAPEATTVAGKMFDMLEEE